MTKVTENNTARETMDIRQFNNYTEIVETVNTVLRNQFPELLGIKFDKEGKNLKHFELLFLTDTLDESSQKSFNKFGGLDYFYTSMETFGYSAKDIDSTRIPIVGNYRQVEIKIESGPIINYIFGEDGNYVFERAVANRILELYIYEVIKTNRLVDFVKCDINHDEFNLYISGVGVLEKSDIYNYIFVNDIINTNFATIFNIKSTDITNLERGYKITLDYRSLEESFKKYVSNK